MIEYSAVWGFSFIYVVLLCGESSYKGRIWEHRAFLRFRRKAQNYWLCMRHLHVSKFSRGGPPNLSLELREPLQASLVREVFLYSPKPPLKKYSSAPQRISLWSFAQIQFSGAIWMRTFQMIKPNHIIKHPWRMRNFKLTDSDETQILVSGLHRWLIM